MNVRFTGLKTGWMSGPRKWWQMEWNLSGKLSQVVYPEGQYWGQFFFIPVLMIWTRGLSVSSISLQVIPSWVEVLICLRVGGLYREIWVGWINGLRPILWDFTRPSARSCTLLITILCSCYRLGQKWLDNCTVEKDSLQPDLTSSAAALWHSHMHCYGFPGKRDQHLLLSASLSQD